MKGDIRSRSMSLALAMAAILALVAPAAIWAEEISWGGPTDLPDYVGAPAKPHSTANSGVPQNPLLAPNGLNSCHLDPWMSDTADIAGPLGINPAVLSSSLSEARKDPLPDPNDAPEWLFECITFMFDSHGRVVALCFAPHESTVVLADADTLELMNRYGEADYLWQQTMLAQLLQEQCAQKRLTPCSGDVPGQPLCGQEACSM